MGQHYNAAPQNALLQIEGIISLEPYILQDGDTWESLADEFGIPIEVLIADNYPVTILIPGELIEIRDEPQPGVTFAIIQTPSGPEVIMVTPENVGFRNPALVPEAALELQSDPSLFPSFELIELLPSAAEIESYNAFHDTYVYADGSRRTRDDLLVEAHSSLNDLPFDPWQATSEWVTAFGGRFDQRDMSPEQKLREELLVSLFALSTFVGDFGEDGVSLDTFLAVFSDLSTEELAEYALDIGFRAEAYQAETGLELDEYFAVYLQDLGLDNAVNFINWSVIPNTLFLAEGYLSSVSLDEIRQILRTWAPQQEERLLIALQAEIDKMPLVPVWGIPVTHIRGRFQSYHSKMEQRQIWLQEQKAFVDEYEQQRRERIEDDEFYQNTSLPWWIELAIGVESELNPLLKAADVLLSLRDVFLYGDPLALTGIIPGVPGYGILRRFVRNATHLLNLRIGSVIGVYSDFYRQRRLVASIIHMMGDNIDREHAAALLNQLTLIELENIAQAASYASDANRIYGLIRGPVDDNARRIVSDLMPFPSQERHISKTIAVTYLRDGSPTERMVIVVNNVNEIRNIWAGQLRVYLEREYPGAIVIFPEVGDYATATHLDTHAEPVLRRALEPGGQLYLMGYDLNDLRAVGISRPTGLCGECDLWLEGLGHPFEVAWWAWGEDIESPDRLTFDHPIWKRVFTR